MNKDVLKEIINDQKETYLNNPIITRSIELEDTVNYCFTGIRRTGKSYTIYQRIKSLLERGVPISQIIYINFEDERLLEFDVNDFDKLLEIGHEAISGNEKPYLFLDELQNIEGWNKFARRVSDLKYNIYITGSNSKMLSKEIASTLGGRFEIVNIFPYSFEEYLKANEFNINNLKLISTKDKALISNKYEEYVTFGAFPELVEIKNKKMYLNNLYQTVFLNDIIARNNISNDFSIRMLIKKVAESLGKQLSYSRLHNILKSSGVSIGKQTVINYMGYICDSYLLFFIQNYNGKLQDKETNPKYYFMDTGLINLFLNDVKTKQLENLIAIELVRRYGTDNVYFYEDNIEVDFYIPDNNLAIQVSFDVSGSEETKERELNALWKLHNRFSETKCILITNCEENIIEYKDIEIEVIPAWKWLLKK